MKSLDMLLAFCGVFVIAADNKIDGCQILQTTDARTPCYILIKQAPGGVPPFLYMLNLPRATPQTPCPVSQTLDASYSCYVPPATDDDPAFILNIPLPPGADELDESPAGKAKLREAKANPIFRKTAAALDLRQGQQVGLSQPIGNSQQIGQPTPFRQPKPFSFAPEYSLPQYQRLAQPIGQNRPIGQTQQSFGRTQQPFGQTQQPFGQTQQPFGQTQQPFGQTQQPFGQAQQPFRQTQQPFGRNLQPFGTPSSPQIGQSQPIFSSSFELTRSTRLPHPIGLTEPIGETRPFGPPSPQLTKAIFKPLTPSLPQIQPPTPQNQFIFRTVPTLFQPQLTQTAPDFPRTQSFHHIVQYQNQQPLYYTSFTQSTQKDSFPYPSAEGTGSISAFEGNEGPYPPSF